MTIRRSWVALTVVVLGCAVLGCSDTSVDSSGTSSRPGSGNDEEGNSDMIWDLRQPTTAKQLGGTDSVASLEAPPGEELTVELELPGLTYRGRWAQVSAATSPLFRNTANPTAVADILVYPDDLDSLPAAVDALRRFEAHWGFSADSCRSVAAFVDDAAGVIEAAGGDLGAADWGTTTAWSFQGKPVNGVEATITLRHPPGAFSPIVALRWDPNQPAADERPVVDDTVAVPAADPSCIPD